MGSKNTIDYLVIQSKKMSIESEQDHEMGNHQSDTKVLGKKCSVHFQGSDNILKTV